MRSREEAEEALRHINDVLFYEAEAMEHEDLLGTRIMKWMTEWFLIADTEGDHIIRQMLKDCRDAGNNN